MTGHLLGAAGSVEAAICALAIKNGIVPPTINLSNQDPGCRLDYVANKAREGAIIPLSRIVLGLAVLMSLVRSVEAAE